MAKPDIQTSAESTNRPEEIEPLKIEAINGVRATVKSVLSRQIPIIIVAGAVGVGVGGIAQDKYRDFTGYDPDKMQDEEIDEDEKQKEEDKPEGLMAKALQKLKDAKDWTADKISQTAIVKKYKESVQELKDMYQKMLEIGDKVAFWLPFLLTFLATIILANKAIKIKKSLTERADPVVERNMQAMEKKLNELIKRVNVVSKQNFVTAEQQVEVMFEMQQLMRTFEAQKPAVEKEISELPVKLKTDEAA